MGLDDPLVDVSIIARYQILSRLPLRTCVSSFCDKAEAVKLLLRWPRSLRANTLCRSAWTTRNRRIGLGLLSAGAGNCHRQDDNNPAGNQLHRSPPLPDLRPTGLGRTNEFARHIEQMCVLHRKNPEWVIYKMEAQPVGNAFFQRSDARSQHG
jgi:hypothetical protein